MVKKNKAIKTTFTKITFGFDKNKLGRSKFYRKGEGKDLSTAIRSLLEQRGNNFLPENQKEEVIRQIKNVYKSLN